MTIKELLQELNQHINSGEIDENKNVWLHHKLKGKIMPAEITIPINKIEYTADGTLLSNEGK